MIHGPTLRVPGSGIHHKSMPARPSRQDKIMNDVYLRAPLVFAISSLHRDPREGGGGRPKG